MHVGDWIVQQIRLLSALVTAPMSEEALADNSVLFAQAMTVLVVVALLLGTVGNQEYWASTVDSVPVLLSWQKLAIKWMLLRKLKGIVLVLAIRQAVMLWSWGFRSPLYDPGPVPVLPASASGFRFRDFASNQLERCNHSVWLGVADTPQHMHPVARALAASRWALFSRDGVAATTPADLQQRTLDEVCRACHGCNDRRQRVHELSDAELRRLDEVAAECIVSRGLEAPGVGLSGTGVLRHSGSKPSGEPRDFGWQSRGSRGWGGGGAHENDPGVQLRSRLAADEPIPRPHETVAKEAGSRRGTNEGSATTASVHSGAAASATSGTAASATSGTTVDQTSGTTVDQTRGMAVDQASGKTVDQTSGITVDQTSGTAANTITGTTASATSGASADQTSGTAADQTSGTAADQTSGMIVDQTSGMTADQTSGASAREGWGTEAPAVWECLEERSLLHAVTPAYVPGAVKPLPQWLPDEHVWAPVPVITRVPTTEHSAVSVSETLRRRLDAALMLAVYLSTVLLLSALDLQILHLPLSSAFSRRMTHASLVALHAAALGLMRTYSRLNRAGVGWPEAALAIVSRAALPVVCIGAVSLLCGLGTSQLIKEHFGTSLVPVAIIASINLAAGLWASRAGDALAEALAADAAAAEGLGLAGGAVPLHAGLQAEARGATGPAIVGASALTGWLAVSGSVWTSVVALQGGIFAPLPWVYGAVLRFSAVSFVVWVVSVWVRWALFVVSSADVFALELSSPRLPTRPVLAEQPKLLQVLDRIYKDIVASLPQKRALGQTAAPAPARQAGTEAGDPGAAPPPPPVAGADRHDASPTAEVLINKIALRVFGLAHAVDRLCNFQDRLVLQQRVEMDVLNLLPRAVVTGRVALQLSIAPPAPPPPPLLPSASVLDAVGLLPRLLAALASALPSPPPDPSPLITATVERFHVPSEDDRRAERDLPPLGRASTTPVRLSTDVRLEFGLHAIAALARAGTSLGASSALGTVRLTLLIDPPPLSATAAAARPAEADPQAGAAATDAAGFVTALQHTAASVAGVLRALTDVTTPQRREVDLATWHDGECSGILGSMRPPTTADLEAQRSKLLAMAHDLQCMVREAQALEMRAAVEELPDRAAAEKHLRVALQQAEGVVLRLLTLTNSAATAATAREARESIPQLIVEAAFVLATVHKAEIVSRPDRAATFATLTRMSTSLLEVFLQSLVAEYTTSTAFPVAAVATACLMCAVQWRYSTRSAASLSSATGALTGLQIPFSAALPAATAGSAPPGPTEFDADLRDAARASGPVETAGHYSSSPGVDDLRNASAPGAREPTAPPELGDLDSSRPGGGSVIHQRFFGDTRSERL